MKLLKGFTESGSGSFKVHHQTRMMAIMLANPRLLLKTTTRLTLKHAVAKRIHPVMNLEQRKMMYLRMRIR